MADPDPITSPAPPALDYAPAPTARRRWGRRVLRWWPAGLLLGVAILGYVYGPPVWKRYKLLKLQEACLTAEIPQDRVVLEGDPAAARALAAARPGEYVLNARGYALRDDPRWAALAAEMGVGPFRASGAGGPSSIDFCHERFTPDGRRRLVVVDGWSDVTVIEPGGWTGGGPRVVWRGSLGWDATSWAAFHQTEGLTGPIRDWAGVPDPVDRSRFTLRFVWQGVAGTMEYRLGDDDRVTCPIVDPAGFTARAIAAWAKRRVGARRW